MKWTQILCYTGVWLQPLSLCGLVRLWHVCQPHGHMSMSLGAAFAAVSLLPTCYVWLSNQNEKKNGKEKFGLLDAFSSAPNPYHGDRYKALRPEVPEHLLYDDPTGVVLGRYQNKYVCRDLADDGHVFLIGGSGSGKSSTLVIPTILSNPHACIFAVDIKGELSAKATKKGDTHTRIFDPLDKESWGYDPFYRLNGNSDSQQIVEEMQTIAFSLIQLPASLKDPFWKNSARNLLIGLLTYHYQAGTTNFVEIVDEVLGQPIRESVDLVMEEAEPNSAEYRYIVQFSDMEDETLSGVFAELANHLVIFANDKNIRYALSSNRKKVNPAMLNTGYSIYLCVREEKLTAYYDLLQLILNQTLAELERRPEGATPILFIMDELPRILSAGRLDKLLDAARTLRSRRVILFMIVQSIEALMVAYSENEAMDLISNCPYIVVLSASSVKTQNMIIQWCGNFKEKRQSWSGSGEKQRTSINYEDREIVRGSDLMRLQQTGEAIIISPDGYYRVKKVPYYADKKLKVKAEAMQTSNQLLLTTKRKDEKSDEEI